MSKHIYDKGGKILIYDDQVKKSNFYLNEVTTVESADDGNIIIKSDGVEVLNVTWPEVLTPVSKDVLDLVEIIDGYLESGSSLSNESIMVNGFNNSIGAGSFVEVSSNGSTVAVLSLADHLRIRAGGNANDASGGTGANTIEVHFLDETWSEVTEEIVCQGASVSAQTTKKAIRVLDVRVKEVGAYRGENAGDIAIESAGGTRVAYIMAGEGKVQAVRYSVPSGKKAIIEEVKVSVGSADSADVRVLKYEGADQVAVPSPAAKEVIWSVSDYSGAFQELVGIEISEKSDIAMEAERVTGSGSARVSGSLKMRIEDV